MKKIQDIERLEREYAVTLWCPGLIGSEGEVAADVDVLLLKSPVGGSAAASLAKQAMEIMDTLDRVPA